MGIGRDINLVEHLIFSIDEVFNYSELPPINNIVLKTDKEEQKWIEETTTSIGDWRSQFRSTYIRWALAINGLSVAVEKYADTNWQSNNSFYIESLRVNKGYPVVNRAVWR